MTLAVNTSALALDEMILPGGALMRRCEKWAMHAPSVLVYSPGQPGRDEVERYIARQFEDYYGARITQFMPYLLALKQGEQIIAAMGLRPAEGTPLFIEQYLDQPIEQEVSVALGEEQPRELLMEIGNLAAMQPGASYLLFMAATEVFFVRGYRWAVFNATLTVQNVLRKLGFSFTSLRNADPARLGSQVDQWGSYYDSPSTVIALSASQAHHILGRTVGCKTLVNTLGAQIAVQAAKLPRASA